MVRCDVSRACGEFPFVTSPANIWDRSFGGLQRFAGPRPRVTPTAEKLREVHHSLPPWLYDAYKVAQEFRIDPMTVLYQWSYCDYLDAYEFVLVQLEYRLQEAEIQEQNTRDLQSSTKGF